MLEAVESLLESHAAGEISRRDAAARLLGVALAAVGAGRALGAEPAPESTFRAVALNHLGLRVVDVERSRDFYRRHLGMTVIQDNAPGNCFLRAGDHYMGLFRSSRPAVDHFCFTVEGYEASDAMRRLAAAGLEPRREADRVYFDDPDGLEVQLDSRFGSWPGPPPAESS